jgi:dipeptidase D
MNKLNTLKPEPVWFYFLEICKIPRASKKEDKIIQYLLDFGKKQKLETARDDIGNVLIRKPATIGKENLKPIVLQSHMDMVWDKNANTRFNFETNPIQPYIDGNWIKAKGTTLGADDGIGMAAQLAILSSKDINHGPVECLFTVDEETGMTGAKNINPGFFSGKILINLDSEDEGELFIGCAGGIDTIATFEYKTGKVPQKSAAYKIGLTGLKGGHSGDEIHKGLGNSVKIINRFLWNATRKFNIRLHDFNGGNLRNAIPREAFAILTLKQKNKDSFERFFAEYTAEIKDEYTITDPELNITLEKTTLPQNIMLQGKQRKLLNALYACPHGVIAWSREIKGLVETSTNLASVKFKGGDQIIATTSQRSSVESAKKDISDQIASVFFLAGAKVVHSDGYPGWKPDTHSEILNITERSYEKLFNTKPVVRAIHAGLECGMFLEKYPNLDMISFGPTIKGAHSPEERLNIKSTEKFWDLLLEVIQNIPEK